MGRIVFSVFIALSTIVSAAEFPGLGPKGNLVGLDFESDQAIVLEGANARVQLLLTGSYTSGQFHDETHLATYQVAPAGIVRVESDGFVVPLQDGVAKITGLVAGKQATIEIEVRSIASPRPINFSNEITPIFTKLGCNSGGCHGKSGGQNGFKLSLLGFYPAEDYEWLVKENRGRRIFPSAPEYSLLITKPLNKLPHGGGRRLDENSYEWQLLVNWIEQGMPYGQEDDPVVAKIEVFPKTRSMDRDTKQQLRVVAHYSDGTTRDVTRLSTYESNETDMADSTTSGLVTVFDRPGEAAVMVRFQGAVTVFRGNIPLGVPVTKLPPVRNFVDQHVFNKLTQLGIPPSDLCDDSAFVRRAYIDITGRLPTAVQARAFVENAAANKRPALVEELLASPGYGDYFANKWAMVLRNQRVNNDATFSFRFHDWIRRAIQQNMPYDEFVRNILVSTGDVDDNPAALWYTQVSTANSQVEDTAQLFLGMRIQCARCHHHPFEKWGQSDYFSFQAFFSQVGLRAGRRGVNNTEVFHRGGIATAKNPRTNVDLKPAGLGGEALDIAPYEDPRHMLVDWMAEPNNPFFARALANRYWKHFFGRGIVDPEDDMRVTNPPSNPELLDALAEHFVRSKFDLKEMVRTICNSSAYQLSSEPNEYNKSDKQNFSSFYPRRLNAEPLYDALNQVAGTRVNFAGMPQGTLAVQLPDNAFNDYFLLVFGKPQAQSACECERSAEANLAQSLHLLNSTDVQGIISSGTGRVAALSANEEMDQADRVTELFYAAFARPPRESELKFVLAYLEKQLDQRKGYEDVLWALFNTKEFLFNR